MLYENIIMQFVRQNNLKALRFVATFYFLFTIVERKEIDEWTPREGFIIEIAKATPSAMRQHESKLFCPMCAQAPIPLAFVEINTWLEWAAI